ncbi:MAG: hypothetical protein KAI73_03935, partial [Rhodospirillaceae bacterium]|nr:hypothetical protein [Rhodospirillaceae bacterium]
MIWVNFKRLQNRHPGHFADTILIMVKASKRILANNNPCISTPVGPLLAPKFCVQKEEDISMTLKHLLTGLATIMAVAVVGVLPASTASAAELPKLSDAK